MDLETLKLRSQIIKETRNFFSEAGYIETDVPVLSSSLIPETCLEVFKTEYIYPGENRKGELYLVPSPEYYMKKLIARFKCSVFQISKCFRNLESRGRIHSPEFTMLEYYSVGKNYIDSIKITEDLIFYLGKKLYGDNLPEIFRPPFLRITVDEAFEKYLGFRLSDFQDFESLKHKAESLDLMLNPETCTTWEEVYNLLFVNSVEPNLPEDKIIFLMDYPAQVPCLAKNKNDFAKERWELYGRGIELANCYTEENDSKKVREYFETETREKNKTAVVPHKVDNEYYKIFETFPETSGVAIGMDRLIALLLDKKTIEPVLPFPLEF